MYIGVCVYIQIYKYILYIGVCIYRNIYTYIFVYIYTHSHTHIHTHRVCWIYSEPNFILTSVL